MGRLVFRDGSDRILLIQQLQLDLLLATIGRWTHTMYTFVAGFVALLFGAGSYFLLVQDWLLAVWMAIVWFVAIRSMSLLWNAPGAAPYIRGGRVSGMLTALVVGAGSLGVGPFLPISPDLRLAIQLLIIGTGTAAWSFVLLQVVRNKDERTMPG